MNRLKDLRTAKKYTQVQMANLLNVDRTTYNKYETENIDPPTSAWIFLANFFNVSVDYLLGLDDDRFILPEISDDDKNILLRLKNLSPKSFDSLLAFLSFIENESKKEE